MKEICNFFIGCKIRKYDSENHIKSFFSPKKRSYVFLAGNNVSVRIFS